ncbi:polyamine aminopropyltransferase [Conexivisphaera calida]|uniref:Polyamine aminopropyltransferase n=1 Tax=Conexivisphaera calida TaxID=1874277 RepID=A0A4P2VHJ0_9ARCH|nr:polyamine aminopropyltransferase [Conexivisphaera calida]BBE42682.1 Spermidine synthase [Conexivisphaera calida]
MTSWKSSYRWVVEWHSPDSGIISVASEILYSGRTKYQEVDIVRNDDYGKMLVLDGKFQSSLSDEFIYHEMLVHPALITQGNPRDVLIVGGGEGATLREVLRYRSVRRAVMVDIDGEVVEICRKYLPEMHQGSFDDPRTTLIIDDGRKFLRETKESFDAVLVDATDPIEGGPSRLLYTVEFYELVRSRLRENGVVATQGTSTFYNASTFARVMNTMRSVFPHVGGYQASIPSYISDWGFVVGSLGRDPASISPEEAEARARELGLSEFKYYEPSHHPYYFWLPPHVRRKVEEEKGVSRDEEPVSVY